MGRAKKIVGYTLLVLIGLPLVAALIVFMAGVFMYKTADFRHPDFSADLSRYTVVEQGDSLRYCGENTLRLNKYGLWETRIAGDAFERGCIYGKLCKNLTDYQEDVFVSGTIDLVGSMYWAKFLHKLVIIFNRNMAQYIPEEYLQEIYGTSLSASHIYDEFGNAYVRQLNYHAAHDIGHAMLGYNLVGCTSFAVWADSSQTGELLIGRNMDFYVSDDFAKNKMVLFMEPDSGYKFVSVSWPGMMGVLSGMNEKGLTVTINSAKGALPKSSAMPVSLLARQILQYASNISEAREIAESYQTFVSESFLIGSVADGCAAIIEKTPETTALFTSKGSKIMCTNHYQSRELANSDANIKNMIKSDSPYRMKRLEQLLDMKAPVSAEAAVDILRNRYGLNNADIGLSNEKSINQFIAHHSVVFKPEKLLMWVSVGPWLSGQFICYDLNRIFSNEYERGAAFVLEDSVIAADSIAIKIDCQNVLTYRALNKRISEAIAKSEVLSQDVLDTFVISNPNYFGVYDKLGDYMASMGKTVEAVAYWQKALTYEIPHTEQRNAIFEKIRAND